MLVRIIFLSCLMLYLSNSFSNERNEYIDKAFFYLISNSTNQKAIAIRSSGFLYLDPTVSSNVSYLYGYRESVENNMILSSIQVVTSDDIYVSKENNKIVREKCNGQYVDIKGLYYSDTSSVPDYQVLIAEKIEIISSEGERHVCFELSSSDIDEIKDSLKRNKVEILYSIE